MTRTSRVLIVVFTMILVLVHNGLQMPLEASPSSNPLLHKALKKKLLRAPEALVKQGIHFYDLTINFPIQGIVSLYSESKSLLATVELKEEPLQRASLYRIHPVDTEESWIRLERHRTETEVLYSATTSTDKIMNIRFETSHVKKGNKSRIPVTGVQVDSGLGWIELSLTDIRNGISLSDKADHTVNPLSQIEEQQLFTTPPLKMLQAVLCNFDALQKHAANKHRKETIGDIVIPLSGCTVNCILTGFLMPLYYCTESREGCCSGANGFWLIADCGIALTCHAECSYFTGEAEIV